MAIENSVSNYFLFTFFDSHNVFDYSLSVVFKGAKQRDMYKILNMWPLCGFHIVYSKFDLFVRFG